MRRALLGVAGLSCALAVAGGGCAGEDAALARLDLEPSVTVSGVSSGAFFAHQFHVAFSDLVQGAALLAGGPYACASNVPAGLLAHPTPEVATALAVCTHVSRDAFGLWGSFIPEAPEAEESEEAVAEAWRAGQIDDPDQIADDRVFLFHGGRDRVVPDGSVAAVEAVYEWLGIGGERLRVERLRRAAHGFPVEDAALDLPACGVGAEPYLIDCDFDAAGALLGHLYGELDPPAEPVREHLRRFDQTGFFDTGDDSVSLADDGYVYVPQDCAAGEEACRLHVAFHGCEQSASAVDDAFVRHAGYNGWAEANRIVVLYPQVERWAPRLDPTGLTGNPRGCWDWWGYSADAFATRQAPQMQAVRQMVAALGVDG